MKNITEYPEMPDVEESLPRVSLIIPYESKMCKQPELFNLLSSAADKIERDLIKNYPEDRAELIMKKFRHLIEGISCRRDKKSIGIFVSPLAEKVYYFTVTDPSKIYFPSGLVQGNSFSGKYFIE